MASQPVANDTEDGPAIDPALFPRLKQWVKDSLDRHAHWYKEADECFSFVSGRALREKHARGGGQWSDDDFDAMIATGRQPIEFNRCGPIVDAICGMEVNNRQEVKYLPRTEGATMVDERLTSLGKWARDETQAEDEESQMFRDAVICGRGATDTYMAFDEEPTGKIIVEQLDPRETGVDPASKKANYVNSRYRWRFRDLPTDEAAAMFPGVIASALDASWARSIDTSDGGEGFKHDYPDHTRASLKADEPLKQVRVVQIQWWERETAYMVAHPTDPEPVEMSEDDWATHGDSLTALGAQHAKVQRRRYYQAFLGRGSVLEQTPVKCFTIQFCTGRLDRKKGYHYGVVRPMRDPQMLANKTLSQVLHILNTNAKGGLIIKKGVFANPRDAEKDWSDPSKTVVVTDMDGIRDRTAPDMPPALVQLQEFSISSIRDTTGVSVELLGLADRDQPASLEYQRRQSAVTILAALFDSLRRYRKLQGVTMLEQLKLMPPGALVRVLVGAQQLDMAKAAYQQQKAQWPQVQQAFQQQMQQWQQIAQQAQQQGQPPPPQPQPPQEPQDPEAQFKDPRGERFDPAAFGLTDDARFDVIVDEAPSSPNQKEAVWATLQPMMTELVGAFPQILPVVLKFSPLPESAAEEISAAVQNGGQQGAIPPQIQEAIAKGQQQIAQLTQENQSLRDNVQVKAAHVQVQQQDADTRRMKAMSDAGVAAHGVQIDYMQLAHAVIEAQRQAHFQEQQAKQQQIGGGDGGND